MKTMKNRSLFGIAAACLLSVVSLHAVQITINEDSATRFDYHAFWGDGPGIAIAQDTSVAMIGMTGRPYGAEARIEATPVSLGLGAVVTDIPVDFSFEVLPVIDLEAPHEVFAYASPKVVPAGHYFIDDDLRGARFVLGEPLSVPEGGSLLVPFGLLLAGSLWMKRRFGQRFEKNWSKKSGGLSRAPRRNPVTTVTWGMRSTLAVEPALWSMPTISASARVRSASAAWLAHE